MRLLLYVFTYFLFCSSIAQPTVSFTFDDGSIHDQGNYKAEEWNKMILDALSDAKVTGAFFVKTRGMSSEKGRAIVKSWDEAGHIIANHTFSHPNFNNEQISAKDFEKELLRADQFIRGYENYTKLFRFPYLKEGKTALKIDSIRHIIKANGYRNGYVTIDASDWYIDSRLRTRLKQDPSFDLTKFRDFYLEHLFNRATYYENISYELTGRHIKHTLLLHHNLAAALFLDDLIAHFQSKGWKIISADEAYEDAIFDQIPSYAGESLIWALAYASGKYEGKLRYPAEDSVYEMEQMDKLGL